MRKQTILYYFPTKEALLAAVIDRSADELSAALEDALVRAGEGWGSSRSGGALGVPARSAAWSFSAYCARSAELGPPPATRLTEALDPLVQRARLFLEARDGQRDDAPSGRLAVLLRVLAVIGVATEVEVLRASASIPPAFARDAAPRSCSASSDLP